MKKKIKTILAVAVVAASAAIGYVSYTQHQNNQLAYANPLMEENINALADDGNGELNWYLHHYSPCQIYVDANVKGKLLKILKLDAEIDCYSDLSCFTQYFNHIASNGEGPCEKDKQVTCNGLLEQLKP